MKQALLAVSVLMSISIPTFSLAADSTWGDVQVEDGVDPWNDQVRYLSWCENNRVVAENASGQNYVKFDCSSEAKNNRCTEKTYRKSGTVWVSAVCEP